MAQTFSLCSSRKRTIRTEVLQNSSAMRTLTHRPPGGSRKSQMKESGGHQVQRTSELCDCRRSLCKSPDKHCEKVASVKPAAAWMVVQNAFALPGPLNQCGPSSHSFMVLEQRYSTIKSHFAKLQLELDLPNSPVGIPLDSPGFSFTR